VIKTPKTPGLCQACGATLVCLACGAAKPIPSLTTEQSFAELRGLIDTCIHRIQAGEDDLDKLRDDVRWLLTFNHEHGSAHDVTSKGVCRSAGCRNGPVPHWAVSTCPNLAPASCPTCGR
jgi:hypothetical protein